ncbi:GerAB/ArcD/ProY family transporter [Bacillus sp. SCS-151]|uniref:GerAB/ArcD/ProY family transporter n=1 Tax=Nanhaiella sioensis TaxID=3115293 RepID=UPI00397D08F3
MPHLNNPLHAKRSMVLGAVVGGGTLVGVPLFCILIMGVDSTTRNIYPTYALAKKLRSVNFINRIEVVVVGV